MRVLWMLLFASCAEAVSRSESSPFSTGSQSPIPLVDSSSGSSEEGSDTTSTSTSESDAGTSTSGTMGAHSSSSSTSGLNSTESGESSGRGSEPEGSTSASTSSSSTGGASSSGGEEQPSSGLYSSCLGPGDCEDPHTDGCFTIADEMTLMVVDGFCTNLCQTGADCGFMPGATCRAVSINPPQSICVLSCQDSSCPDAMACTQVELAGLICV